MDEVQAALTKFKAFVAAIEPIDGTLELDKDLAIAVYLLYDVRQKIDLVWAERRRAAKPIQRPDQPRAKPSLDQLMDLIR